jgi:hypothetical protein
VETSLVISNDFMLVASMRVLPLAVAAILFLVSGCRILEPKLIEAEQNNLPSELIRDQEAQLERGKPHRLIDGFGWGWGIPSKLTLWNRRIDNHNISPATEQIVDEYLEASNLGEIKVRLNQYYPLDDWRRLVRNKSVAWPIRYTFGAVATLNETVVPGRLFGGDHFNPYTGTIHLYSDVPAVALHEAAHAKDFSRRSYPGLYSVAYAVPFVSLWHERLATNDVLAYVQQQSQMDPAFAPVEQEAYHVLYPAYGTYLGGAAGRLAPSKYSSPLYAAGVIQGHANGRLKAP